MDQEMTFEQAKDQIEEIIKEMKPTIIYKGTKDIEGVNEKVNDNVKILIKVIEKEDPNLYIGETRTEKGQCTLLFGFGYPYP